MDRDKMIQDRLNAWAALSPEERGKVREKRLDMLVESRRCGIDSPKLIPYADYEALLLRAKAAWAVLVRAKNPTPEMKSAIRLLEGYKEG